jgi:hypothetical protein
VTSAVLRPRAGANPPRWDGSARGHYEVWYVTLSDPDSGRGFWFRYTLEAPLDPARDPVAELWGFAFTPGRPAVGAKATFPVAWPPGGGAVMRAGDGVLEDGRAVGEVAGLSWDLRWDVPSTAMWHIPGRLGRSAVPSTRVVCPALGVTISGRVTVAGETVELTGARGCQTHLWGRQHAARWAWGHCSAFRDGEGSALVEAVWAVPLLRPGRPAPAGATLLYAEVDGVPLACNAWPWVAMARSRVESPRWELRGRTRDARVRAVLEADVGEMAQVTYEDPDGSHAWCANSEIARGLLEVEWRDGRHRRFTTERLAHVEFGTRAPDPRIPVLC